ncbi:hypothetical protein LZ32DRAFT_612211 [Colletotrichum eremochloae]|nr:hypothetical protein LZ32DRAFT_612211 [Colletotrichum eremochloae]
MRRRFSELDHSGCKSYGEIVSYFEENHIARQFRGPSNRLKVDGKLKHSVWIDDIAGGSSKYYCNYKPGRSSLGCCSHQC